MIGNNKDNFLILKISIVLVTLVLFINRSWAGEDAFIFFRYVDNFVNGNGLVFNIGERIEGFTSPLWVFFLAILRVITPLELRQIAIISGLTLSSAAILLILLFDSSKKLFLPIGVIILITNSAFRDFATSGFETSLTYLLLASLALLIKKNQLWKFPFLIGVISSLLALNRPEAILFTIYIFTILVLMGIRGLKSKSIPLSTSINKLVYFVLPIIILIGGYQIFRMGYFASMLPNTFYAKKGGELYISQGIYYLKDFLSSYWFSFAIILLGSTILIKSKLPLTLKKFLSDGELHILIMALLPLFYVLYSGGDYMHGRSLLMTFLLICISINTVFEKFSKANLISLFYSISALVLVFLISVSQVPITNSAGKQINGIKDERFHFGFGFKDGEFREYFNQRITGQFNWANRGYYYKELSEKLGIPIRVVMGNIGFFGYAAEENVNVMGSSLTDPYLARYEIKKRGTIGHEGEAHYDYIFSRKPNFAYTPFVIWNQAGHFKDEKLKHADAITSDNDDSFIPVFDLSDEKFIGSFSKLIETDIKKEIDTSIVKYIQEISTQKPLTNFKETTQFFGFLSVYWAPYASKLDNDLFANVRNKIWGQNILSEYEAFDMKLKSESEQLLHRTNSQLTPNLFFNNISYAFGNSGKDINEYKYLISISNEADLKQPNVKSSDSIIFDKVYGLFYVTPGLQTGDIKLNINPIENKRDNYILKIVYRIANPENSLSVICEKCEDRKTIYKHDPRISGESQDKVEVYLDITEEILETSEITIQLDRPQGPAAFEVGIISIEVF